MRTFKQHLQEMAFSTLEGDKVDEVMQAIKKLGDAPVLWRGQTAVAKTIGKMTFYHKGVVHVTNDRGMSQFRGMFSKLGEDSPALDVVLGLGLTHTPVFCSFDQKQAKFFGTLGAIVPVDPRFTLYWHNTVHDLLTHFHGEDDEWIEDEKEYLLKSYQSTTQLSSPHRGECILDCAEYYWVTPSTYLDLAAKSKFNDIKNIEQIHTYVDLYKVYKSYKSYVEWSSNRYK